MENLHLVLKNARLAKSLTLEQLSIETGISVATISRYENDKVRPSLDKAMKLFKALNIKYV